MRCRTLVSVGMVLGALAAPVAAQDWDTVPVIQHKDYQAVNADGSSAYGTVFPIRLIGVVLNDTEDWLDPTPAFSTPTGWPPPPPPQMGGEAEFYVQAIDLDGTAWDPEPGSAFDDFGGTACWMGQNYGNLWTQDSLYSYSDAEWTAELGRLNLQGGDGVTDPIRAGDLVEIRSRAGLHYKGKMNVNEQHDNDYDRLDDWDGQGSAGDGKNHDFEVVRLVAGYGLPAATELALSDLKHSDDSFIWDATRQSGPEHYQSSWVELQDVWVAAAASWTANTDVAVTDGLRTFNMHLCRSAAFDGTELFAPGEHFDALGILDQAATDGVYSTDGYQLLVLDPAALTVPAPAGLALLAAGAVALLRRR